MTGLLEKIGLVFRANRRKQAQSYEGLVVKIAAGKDIDAAEAAAILEAADKQPTDLLADVERRQKRLQWRAQLDDAEVAKTERNQLNAELEKARANFDAKLSQLHGEFNSTVREKQAASDAANARFAHAKQARQNLIDTAAPELVEQEAVLNQQMQSCREHTQRLKAQLVQMQQNAKREEGWEAKVSYAQQQLTAAERDEAETLAQLESIRAAKLEV